MYKQLLCEGQAIKQNMSGRRYNVQFSKKKCGWVEEDGIKMHDFVHVVCAGAKKLKVYPFDVDFSAWTSVEVTPEELRRIQERGY